MSAGGALYGSSAACMTTSQNNQYREEKFVIHSFILGCFFRFGATETFLINN
jgi:hypothetical protein